MSSSFLTPGNFQNVSTQGQNLRVREDMMRLRQQATNAQIQLSSGYKFETHGGLKAQATVAQELRHKMNRVDGYYQSIKTVELRLQGVQQAMNTVRDSVTDVREGAVDAFAPGTADGMQSSRVRARSAVGGIVSLLNTSQSNRHLFSGAEVSTAPVAGPDALLDGEGGRIGLKAVMERRLAADMGTGDGRLSTGVGGTVVTLTHDGGAFGMRPTSISGPGTGGPTAATDVSTTATIDAGVVADGDTVTLGFEMPDGTAVSIALIATTTIPLPDSPGKDIQYFEAGNVASLETVLNNAVSTVIDREMTGASAIAAGNDFFDHSVARIPDDPAASATRLVMNSSSVIDWFTPESPPIQVKEIAADPGALVPAPVRGETYIVDAAAVGLWAGHDGQLATFNGVGWTFTEPEVGTRAMPEPATAADTQRVFTFQAGNIWTDTGAAPPQTSARDSVQGKVDDGLLVSHGVRADEPGIRDSLKAAAVLAAAGYDPNDADPFQQVAKKISVKAYLAHGDAVAIQAELGVIEERTRSLGERHLEFRTLLNRQIVGVEGVDQFELAARLQELMTRLQASFAIVTRLQNMNLASHL